MIYVLDSTAMIAFLTNEQGAEVIEDILTEPNSVCLAHAINLCEIWYQAFRTGGEAAADQAINLLASIGIATRSDFDQPFWREAGKLKGTHRMSLADALGLALTLRVGGEFITSDHHELDPVAAAGLVPITFFRELMDWKEALCMNHKVTLPDDTDYDLNDDVAPEHGSDVKPHLQLLHT